MTSREISAQEFLRNLQESGLLPAEEYEQQVVAATGAVDGLSLIRHLTNSQILTMFQAEAVVERRFEQLRLGNYDVLAKLGAGGMGTVYKARHRRMKRIVAVKLLTGEAAREAAFVQRFQREIETIAQLSHPNIVMAYDADEAEVGHFLVMEFVDGRDLASEVQVSGPLSVAATVDFITQAAAGLAFAHSKGIVHRDIKPANLMLTTDGVVKVADLGLARLAKVATDGSQNTSLTQAGGILGTLDYMPPEQALDSTSIDHRADIYSLGCSLYFLLTGKAPYFAGSMMGLLLQHRDAKIPDLRGLRPDVPFALVAAFERMLAKNPADRPTDMTEVVRLMSALKPQVKDLLVRPNAKPTTIVSHTDVTIDSGVGSSLIAPPTVVNTGSNSTVGQNQSDLIVVLVEPSRTQSAIVRSYLTQLGLSNIFTTASGAEALELVKKHDAHVVVSTMHLKEMTGVQLVTALHADPLSRTVGFVLMSSEADKSQSDAVLVNPKTVLLLKPFDLKQLALALATATERPMAAFTLPA